MWKTKNKMFAAGRLKSGQMNKLEQAYAEHLKALQRAGEVEWWRFEGIKLRLADKTFFNVDFAVMLSTGEMQMHEVKGFMMDDANVKLKVAAETYPFRFMLVKKAKGGQWSITEVGNQEAQS
jgi:hypothetical protein